jgi:hypothetical protein
MAECSTATCTYLDFHLLDRLLWFVGGVRALVIISIRNGFCPCVAGCVARRGDEAYGYVLQNLLLFCQINRFALLEDDPMLSERAASIEYTTPRSSRLKIGEYVERRELSNVSMLNTR